MCAQSYMSFFSHVCICEPTTTVKTQNYSITTKILFMLYLYSHAPFNFLIPEQPLMFSFTNFCHFEDFIYNTSVCTFGDWLSNLALFYLMPLRSNQVVACIKAVHFFLFLSIPWYGCLQFNYSCIEEFLIVFRQFQIVWEQGASQIKLLRTLMCKLCRYYLSVLRDISQKYTCWN